MKKEYLRIAVTGGRDYPNKDLIFKVLDKQKLICETVGCKMFLVVGDATGADAYARLWAFEHLPTEDWQMFEADWTRWGKSAGHRRNRDMLISGIDKLCAFPGGNGTADMTRICRNVGIFVKEYK
jgi:hypothetical protein